MSRRLLACGEHAVLVELEELEEVLALADVVRAVVKAGTGAFANVVDVVPAARTLLVVVNHEAALGPLREALTTLTLPEDGSTDAGAPNQPSRSSRPGRPRRPTDGTPPDDPEVVEVLVHYDGPDLDGVCELTGLTPHEVIAAHTQTPWRVAFSGFAPGFAYLCGGDSRLRVPRHSEPRTSVPAGAVALAGEFSAVYPRSSPGGWQLLGSTDAILWDVDRKPPALLQPGCTVHFVDADAREVSP